MRHAPEAVDAARGRRRLRRRHGLRPADPIRGIVPLAAGTLALLLSSCATSDTGATSRGGENLHPRLTATTYYEEGGLAFIAVDTMSARAHRDSDVLALPFMYVNKMETSVRLTAEGILLYDAEDSAYPLVGYSEFRSRHAAWLGIDRRLSLGFIQATNQYLQIEPSLLTRYRFTPLPFYAAGTGHADEVVVPPGHFTRGSIYFPMPARGVDKQRFDLLVTSSDLPEDIVLKFRTN